MIAHLASAACRARRGTAALLTLGLLGLVALSEPDAQAQVKKKGTGKTIQVSKPVAPQPPRSALLTNDAWRNAKLAPVAAAEIDQLVLKELQHSKVEPAPLTTDEQFIRRVSLDLTGRLPSPGEISSFVGDPSSQKRAKLIDKLLDSDAYAQHWARYWRDVIAARVTDRRGMLLARSFEEWMTGQLKSNRSWSEITRTLLTAEGTARYDKPNEGNGEAFFLLSAFGAEAANDRAAETSRIFLGIQIRCAQCHNHPFDQWKQVQFHELAAYYARLRERPVRENQKLVGVQLISLPRGEHEMAEKNDPKKTFVTHPQFLDGRSPSRDLPDKARRAALADAVVDKNNYWFAGAYVNRIWGELMGQSFYQPIDDMGPGKEAVFGSVLTRLAGAFRATNYDTKALLRAILNSQTYQRQIRLGESTDEHLHFAAAYPKKLSADAVWDSLVNALGQFAQPARPAGQRPGMGLFRAGLEGEIKRLFAFDPSLKADEVEGSIAQALMLMNNPAITQRMKAQGGTPLAKILSDHPKDDDAIREVYLRTLARKPTDRELSKCKAYIGKVGNRAEAFEDLLWALINSTEFQTKR